MPDRDVPSIGAELIQLERALSKLVRAAENYLHVVTQENAAYLTDALENARNHLT
jgi:hypothetical protein